MTDETEKTQPRQPLKVVKPVIDDAFIADVRRELGEVKRAVREVASRIDTLSDAGRGVKAR